MFNIRRLIYRMFKYTHIWCKFLNTFALEIFFCANIDARVMNYSWRAALFLASALFHIVARNLTFNVARPLPAALFRKAMKHDVHRRNRFYFVEARATRAVSPTYLHAGSRITLLRIPCDNTVNHADRSASFLRRTFLRPRKNAYIVIFVIGETRSFI